MSNNSSISRRQIIATIGSVGIAGLAGCSSGDTDTQENTTPPTTTTEPTETSDTTENPEQTTTTPQNTTEGDIPTGYSGPEDNVIDSLLDYNWVAHNDEMYNVEWEGDHKEEWIGETISVPNTEQTTPTHYDVYGEYEVFRAFTDPTRPFFIQTDQEFEENEQISFTGTIQKFMTFNGVEVICIENAEINPSV